MHPPRSHWTTWHYAASVATLEDKIAWRDAAEVVNAVYEANNNRASGPYGLALSGLDWIQRDIRHII